MPYYIIYDRNDNNNIKNNNYKPFLLNIWEVVIIIKLILLLLKKKCIKLSNKLKNFCELLFKISVLLIYNTYLSYFTCIEWAELSSQ